MKNAKGGSGPIKNNPVTGFTWPDKGRKNMGDIGTDGPIVNSPINHAKWPNKGRKN